MIVHLVLNSHLDPVWLWNRQQGIDEVLCTARTACRLLEDYPELVLTRGEVWFYEIVEALDPALFERIRRHVESGRWQVVGNWYVQPDCNLPGPASFRHHNALGTRYFREKFGVQVRVGYNVDSFGHAATLPDFYREAGIEYYVMQRPGPHEKELPGNTFRWESPAGNQVTVFRLVPGYNSDGSEESLRRSLDLALAAADPRLGRVMCFLGIGDHGGGPARCEIEFLRRNLRYRPEVELRFSHPLAYFEEVRASGVELPVVRGELQHHAIGCYSAVNRIKRELHRSEDLLTRAEALAARDPELVPVDTPGQLERAWKKVLFATFHDVLAGSSLQSAYTEMYDDLGSACSTAQEVLTAVTRKRNAALAPNRLQQLVLDNPEPVAYDGYFECEPWRHYLNEFVGYDRRRSRILDADGNEVPAQLIPAAACCGWGQRYVFRVRVPAGGRTILQYALDRDPAPAPGTPVRVDRSGLANGRLRVRPGATGIDSIHDGTREWLRRPLKVTVIDDPSDTWSHGLKCYGVVPSAVFRAVAPGRTTLNGPLLGEEVRKLGAGENRLRLFTRLYAGMRELELRLRLDWRGLRQLVKLELQPAFEVVRRLDGVTGGELERPLDGEEYPFFEYTRLRSADGRELAVVSRDLFSCDVQPDGTLRLTLLRSPYYAHHDPKEVGPDEDYPVVDQGIQEYRITLLLQPESGALEQAILRQSEPLIFSESTSGMELPEQ